MTDGILAIIRGEQRGLGPSLVRLALWTLSVPYAWAVRLRNWAFEHGWKKVYTAGVPVVSIGNLTAGGTGKTPCVEYVARFFRRRGVRVAILSRGYGSPTGPNDEARLLEHNLPDVPHLQGPDRVALARRAVEDLGSELLILDDGLQHRRLGRDLEVVLIDATNPWGHGHLLPRGLLREPMSSLARADLVVLTRCDLVADPERQALVQRIEQLVPGVAVIESVHRPEGWVNHRGEVQQKDTWSGRPVATFCGVGNPDAFRRALVKLGHEVIAWRTFGDHHHYTRADIESLRVWAEQLPAATVIATTQKDLVKIAETELAHRPLWALRISLEVTRNKDVLDDLLLTIDVQEQTRRVRVG